MASNTKKRSAKTEEANDVQTTQVTQESAPLEPTVDVSENSDEQEQTPEIETDVVEAVIQDEKPVPQETEQDEQIRLAKELNLTIRTDPQSGKAILPSTPAMRAAAARQAYKPVVENTGINLDDYVLENYGDMASENPNIKLVTATLTDYIKRMNPASSIDETTGGEQQAKLANMYDVVLSLKPEIAQMALEIVVAVVKQNQRGAFNQTAALRFANTMPLNSERALRFQLLTTLFISLAGGTTKKDLAKTLNIRQLLEYITDRNAKANISEFIN